MKIKEILNEWPKDPDEPYSASIIHNVKDDSFEIHHAGQSNPSILSRKEFEVLHRKIMKDPSPKGHDKDLKQLFMHKGNQKEWRLASINEEIKEKTFDEWVELLVLVVEQDEKAIKRAVKQSAMDLNLLVGKVAKQIHVPENIRSKVVLAAADKVSI